MPTIWSSLNFDFRNDYSLSLLDGLGWKSLRETEMLDDILTALILPGPSSDRGRLLVSLALGTIAFVCEVWIFAVTGAFLHGPDWAFGLTMVSVVCAIVGLAIGAAYMLLKESDRLLSYAATGVSAVALVWPLLDV
jgi:hypothetical protein